jgi:hypothetical protein
MKPSKQITQYPNGHRISPADFVRGHIKCDHCDQPAAFCEYSRYSLPTRKPTTGISFFNYCEVHWTSKGPSGSSPKERAMGLR